MPAEARPRPILDPTERFSEVLFGLLMVLTFTGTLSITAEGHAEVRTMLIGAIGCNFAWGLVDAVMYVLASIALRARNLHLLREVKASRDPAAAHRIIAEALPPRIAALMGPADLEKLRAGLSATPEPDRRTPLRRVDFLAAGAIFLLVFLSTFPVAIPFLVVHDPAVALRASNAVALVMLFLLGHSLGRYMGARGWMMGLGMLVLGLVLVAIIIALGG